ncbi:TPA: 3-isopropylmalate dehydratase small subunit [bacterium]|nr:3-isopropylmalate dehydratase small subunit [bacterium]
MEGIVYKFGDDINTDQIIPAIYLDTTDPNELASHCMEGIEGGRRINKGGIIVSGKNFGCGSSREHAPLAIKASGIQAIIAKSFARIFFRNSINIGLPVIECSEVNKIDEGDLLNIIPKQGKIENLTKNETYYTKPYPPFMQKIIEKGGLISSIDL